MQRLLLTVSMLLFTPPGAAQVAQLLQQVTAAYGGLEQVTAAREFRQYGVTTLEGGGPEAPIERAYRYPDHLRVEIDYGRRGRELRLLAGQQSWSGDRPGSSRFYASMLLQAARLGLPGILLQFQGLVRASGTLPDRRGGELLALELDFHGSYRLTVGIDAASGRIMESRGSMRLNGSRMEFDTLYDDFRMQDGRLFAFSEVHYAMGRKTGSTRLARIEPANGLPDRLFLPDTQPDTELMAGIRVLRPMHPVRHAAAIPAPGIRRCRMDAAPLRIGSAAPDSYLQYLVYATGLEGVRTGLP